MRKAVIGTTVLAAASAVVVVALRRFGPGLAERGMKKCHEMMERMAERGTSELSVQCQGDCAEGSREGEQKPLVGDVS